MSPKAKTSSGPSRKASPARAKPKPAAAAEPAAEPEVTAPAAPAAAPTAEFTYRPTGATVIIFWRGRQVRTVGGAVGMQLRNRLRAASDDEAQQLLARASGDFKRGNERQR